MRSLHLFAGAGGGLLADLVLGHTPIGAVEINPYCCNVLRARRDDGWFPGLAVHEIDMRDFDPSEYAGRVDIVAGGFPCQDISAAGKGAGITGERSGLWSEFARIVRVVRPRYAFIENSPMLTLRGLDVVLADLAALGMDAVWKVISAAQAGAPHRRERIWILANARGGRCGEVGGCNVAHSNGVRELQPQGRECDQRGWAGNGGQAVPDTDTPRLHRRCEVGQSATGWQSAPGGGHDATGCGGGEWWQSEPSLGRVAHGVAHRVDRLKALGNGQVPIQAALAWKMLEQRYA